MKCEHHRKTATSATKGKTATGLSCAKPGMSTNKGAKQRRKTAGNKLVSFQSEQQGCTKIQPLSSGENGEEVSGQCLLSPTPPLSPAVSTFVPEQASIGSQKFKLQLFPVDDVTRSGLELEKHNPYLELTIGARKKISSVVKHLNVKWGKPRMVPGELMLFPYYVRLENLTSHRRWTLKDSHTTATDVHAAVGSPAIFRLRYGWFFDTGLEISNMPLMSPLSENSLRYSVNEIKNTADSEMHACSIESQVHGPVPADDSSNQDVSKPIQLDNTVKPLDNQKTANSSVLLWDLSNISFGALLSEASRNVTTSQITCDSFDAAVARYKATTVQSTPVPQPSILDAEETCNAFCFQKITSSSVTAPAQLQDAPVVSCVQNISSNLLGLQDALNSPVGHAQDNACQQSTLNQLPHTTGEDTVQLRVDSQHLIHDAVYEGHTSQANTEASRNETNCWPDSLGHWEYAAPVSKQFIGGDSMGLDGLIASSLDAFQNFSIF